MSAPGIAFALLVLPTVPVSAAGTGADHQYPVPDNQITTRQAHLKDVREPSTKSRRPAATSCMTTGSRLIPVQRLSQRQKPPARPRRNIEVRSMKSTLQWFGLIAILLTCCVLATGCTRPWGAQGSAAVAQVTAGNPTQSAIHTAPSHTATAAQQQSCTGLKGDICIAGEDCAGTWLAASDSSSCCSRPCT